MTELQKIPFLGAGIGLRTDLAADTLSNSKEVQVVEVIAEHYFSESSIAYNQLLKRTRAVMPIIPHGIDLSIASPGPLEEWYMKEARTLMDSIGAHYFSDHFALTRDHDELDIGHLSPVWYTKELLENIVARVNEFQSFTGKPLVLENITASFIIPGGDFDEPEFIAEVCRRTGCGLLLDVTNVFINAYNRKENAQKLLERYPLNSVVQIHLAGGVERDGKMYDSHSAPLEGPNAGIWPLYEYAIKNSDVKAVIIERDDDFAPSFEETVLNDLRKARAILEAHRSNV